MREAHVSAQQPKAQQDSRLSQPDADPGRSGGAQGPPGPGPQAARRLTQPIRDRGTFEALARTQPVRRGALSVRSVDAATSGPAWVSYAVGRHTGGAVARNRARRRLRAALARHTDDLRPGTAYLVGAGPETLTMPFDQLVERLGELLARSHRTAR
jgi:ribonuclease P protein component